MKFWPWLVTIAVWSVVSSGALAQECVFGEAQKTCGKQGCIVSGDLPEAGDKGSCGPCENDAQCDGTKCDLGTHTCEAPGIIVPTPQPWYPRYHLGVVDAALDVNRRSKLDVAATFGSGYWFRGAFREVSVVPAADGRGGYEAPDPPQWFFHVGAAIAVVSSAQNVFAEAALFHYTPASVLTGYTLGALYQRQGASIWKLGNSSENSDRIGPALGVELLHNITLRVSYEFPARGPLDYQSLMFSLVYMKTLVSDLVPEHYQKYVPDYL